MTDPKGSPMTPPLDRLPVEGQHLVLAVLPVLLGWLGSDLVPWFSTHNPTVAYLLGILLTVATTWLTKVTRQYGRGSVTA